MLRVLNILLLVAVIAGTAVVYNMKHEAEAAAERVTRLQREIDEQHGTISLLKAEWSVLNQPARLQRLVERYNSYLRLQPLDVGQIATVEDLPAKPINFAPYGNAPSLGGYAGGESTIR